MSPATQGEDASTLAYAQLQPEDILETVEGLGYRCDGRLLALNSYENRVYQVGIEDSSPIVAKFYRPGRWSDDAIIEEHRFSAELADREIPIVAPLAADGRTLHHTGHFRVSLAPWRGGRAPELDDEQLLCQVGRLVARIHLQGQVNEFEHRPALGARVTKMVQTGQAPALALPAPD